ncbi:DUF2760 domain-containing protein [Marinomonas mediterranea]|uniref:DUF2760 domain-containing protein n=1 Tax=Marinomonas mediterranea TaxID=119864 RepID=UPI0023492397|nr:DUF2760 domain-containing protein [Marinomonas mediterranea]WCN09305.1 DUF2760 domain-containing protein [Marinomonas mediterranea]
MSKEINAIGFVPRFFGAFGQFFKYMGNGNYAARCNEVSSGSKFEFEVEPKIITEEVEVIREIQIEAPMLDTVNTDGALQLLQLLQKEARFIDFTQESIDAYSDEEIGGAARQIHSGCSKVIQQYFSLDSVHEATENSRVEVPADYSPQQIKLEGLVQGDGPYTGTLIHPGWEITDIKLPKVSDTGGLSIIAPAEVEV